MNEKEKMDVVDFMNLRNELKESDKNDKYGLGKGRLNKFVEEYKLRTGKVPNTENDYWLLIRREIRDYHELAAEVYFKTLLANRLRELEQEEERERAKMPIARTEWDEWANKNINAINSRLDIGDQRINECVQAHNNWIAEINKRLVILSEKEAKLDAAILRASTLEASYLKTFKNAMDKNSVQPQKTPATPGSAPKEGSAFNSATPQQSMALQATKGFIPKAEDVLNHPNAVQLGKKSIRLLQKLAEIMDRKALFVFTQDNAQDWLKLGGRTSYQHLANWQKFGFIEKKSKGLYAFLPQTTTTATPTQPHAEDSQQTEGA